MAAARSFRMQGDTPTRRTLRVFAFDPSFATRLSLADINETTVDIPWESPAEPGRRGGMTRGPVGEYLEVIDHDPASGCFYPPIDLNAANVLATDGLTPDEGDPRFHQQMVYAVSMRVIETFERALGRRVLWNSRDKDDRGELIKGWEKRFVRRLRVYPHALREANAYYSSDKAALLFGYFPAGAGDAAGLPGGVVFSCLSHDIIAHEVTHAVLDGSHGLFLESTGPDALAFHEGFADIVALMSHFSLPKALRHQIARTRGDLRAENALGELAVQFGAATGRRGALRSAIGTIGPDGRWKARTPDPTQLGRITEPHERGAILVAAVFGAFLSIYERRTRPIVRLATGGTGVLPPGELSELLVESLAEEASRAAAHTLRLCIRALDYMPPGEATFGEFLRALVTADADVRPTDDMGYRVAFIEGFRAWGILPPGVTSLAERSLLWQPPSKPTDGFGWFAGELARPASPGEKRAMGGDGTPLDPIRDFRIGEDRRDLFVRAQLYQQRITSVWVERLRKDPNRARELGIEVGHNAPGTVRRLSGGRGPAVWVRSVRPARRVHEGGASSHDLVVELVQSRAVYATDKDQKAADAGEKPDAPPLTRIRGGATLLIDVDEGCCRYCIHKSVMRDRRLKAAREWSLETGMTASFDGDEPLAFLHRHG
ncbi:MAG TPA: hypothetical protein VD971_02185 [Phycisphaerales bacterium]|nr:hypothetical protein [Phycisphaerales bacterium]